jgi:hypothetical protein
MLGLISMQHCYRVDGYYCCVVDRHCFFPAELYVDLDVDVDVDCRTGSLHLGPCIRALCAPHWNSFPPPSPEALRTHRRERPLLAREGN